MTVWLWLFLLLAVLMIVIGGSNGGYAFLSLTLNIGLFLIAVLSINWGLPIYLVTFAACLLMALVNLFFTNGTSTKTVYAFWATCLTMLLLLGLVWLVQGADIMGFAEEELLELEQMNLAVGLSYRQLGVAVLLMGMMGAVTDAAISITSSLAEIKEQKRLAPKELFAAGLRIGQDILGTTVNTLLFAFLGSGLALFFWFYDLDYSLQELFNSKVFAEEILSALTIASASLLVIPIAAALMAWRDPS